MERRKHMRPTYKKSPTGHVPHNPHYWGYDHFPHYQYVIFDADDDDDYYYYGKLGEGNKTNHDMNPYPPPPPPPPPPMPPPPMAGYSSQIDYQFQWELQRAYMKGFDAGFAAAIAYKKSEEAEEGETTTFETGNEKE